MAPQPDSRTMENSLARWLARTGSAIVLVPLTLIAGLVLADWREAPRTAPEFVPSVSWAIDRGDRLHYVGHLVLGRLLELCPCTAPMAADQYDRADAHARTTRQR